MGGTILTEKALATGIADARKEDDQRNLTRSTHQLRQKTQTLGVNPFASSVDFIHRNSIIFIYFIAGRVSCSAPFFVRAHAFALSHVLQAMAANVEML